jgi:hypothetical protein
MICFTEDVPYQRQIYPLYFNITLDLENDYRAGVYNPSTVTPTDRIELLYVSGETQQSGTGDRSYDYRPRLWKYCAGVAFGIAEIRLWYDCEWRTKVMV